MMAKPMKTLARIALSNDPVFNKNMLFAGLGSVRMVKNCDLGRENAALRLLPLAAFSSPRSQFFTIRTSQPANNRCVALWIISNYWMRLSRIWIILQIKEGVIHRGRRPRWITPSEICRILHILPKPNSIIVYYSFKIFPRSWRSFAISLFVFPLTKITQPCPQVFSVNGSIICSGLYFWRHFDVLGSIIFSGLHVWRHWFNIWSTAAGCGELCVRF